MQIMDGKDLLEMLQANGLKYAVVVAHMAGKPRAILALVDGTCIGMDQPMLEAVLPMLHTALDKLKLGDVPGGPIQQ
jgi:hypothetical protein